MSDSARQKIDRATQHITELSGLFLKRKPFTYVLETDILTGERATFAKKNKLVVDEASGISGDIVHNLRSSLDHAYWKIVSPFAGTQAEKKAIQFPFSKTKGKLKEAISNRLADRVSPTFFKALLDLQPHGEPGGNELLYMIHELDIIDKHQFPIPTGNYSEITGDIMQRQIPDFPFSGSGANTVSFTGRDVSWTTRQIPPGTLGDIKPPTTHIYEKVLDVPVEIVFQPRSDGEPRPLISTLNQLIEVARTTVLVIQDA